MQDSKPCISHPGYSSACMVHTPKEKCKNNALDKTLKAFLFKVIMNSIYAY